MRIRKGINGFLPIWRGVCKNPQAFWNCISFRMGNGTSICFWEDRWLQEVPLCDAYEKLYKQIVKPNLPISSYWNTRYLKRRKPTWGPLTRLQNNQEAIMELLNLIRLSHVVDTPIWKLSSNGAFPINSFYDFLNFEGLKCPFYPIL